MRLIVTQRDQNYRSFAYISTELELRLSCGFFRNYMCTIISCAIGEVKEETKCIVETFDIQFETGSESSINSLVVEYEELLEVQDNPTKDGYEFGGWYIDDTFEIEFDMNQPITKNYILYAKWNLDLFTEIEQYLLTQNFNGTVLLSTSDKDLLSKGYGYANKNQLIANTPNTIFHIGSVTKQFTAAAILLLEEDDLLSVDDTVSQYIDGIPNGDIITIHHLLTQSSGLLEYTNMIDWSDNEFLNSTVSPQSLIDLINDKTPLFNPGNEFNYCNTNNLLLGYIIEIVSGITYGEFINQNIFEPLGMTESEVYEMAYDSRYAVGYEELTAQSNTEIVKYHPSVPFAAGAIASSTLDLYKWHIGLQENTILSLESTDKMFKYYISAGYGGYGYRWVIIENGEYPIMEHAGSLTVLEGIFTVT